MKKIIYLAEWLLALSIFFFLNLSPFRIKFFIGARIGDLFYFFRVRRAVAIDNLIRAGIGKNQAEALSLLLRCYRHFGRGMMEFLAMNSTDWREGKDYRLSLPDHFIERSKNGAVLISAHLGNWELMGKILVQKNIPLAVVVQRQANPCTDRWFRRIRENAGMTVVDSADVWPMIRLIRTGYVLALLSDQDLGGRSEIVSFFGRSCRTPSGGAELALRLKIPLWIAYAIRQHDCSHSFVIEPLPICSGDTVRSVVQRFTARLEEIIRQNPEQWFWMHRRWKI